MSFCKNTSQQISIFDSLSNLTERERKRLKNSWAEKFSNEIFPLINENRFSVLYSNNHASRPNNPVNVYVGLLMLREIFSQSDEEALDSLMFDARYQYALHTSSFEEQPISKNSLTNFRSAVYKYNEEHSVDLIQEEIESHAKEFAKILNIDGRNMRMDSLMISTSAKKLSRLEIIYSCVSRLIHEINKSNADILPDKFKVYLEDGHHNDTIYRCKDKDIESKLNALTADAIELFYISRGSVIEETQDFKILTRMLGEQTKQNEGNIELKPAKEISPISLQNPTDPDATYRNKGNKGNIGYVGNILESFDDKNKLIMQYDLQKNTYSDQQFSKDIIEKLGLQEKDTNVIVDGAYYSEKISKQASENKLNFIPTNLVGRDQSTDKTGYDKFNIDEETHEVKNCSQGHKPEDSKFKKNVYRAHFNPQHCDNCPQRANCPVTKQKKNYLLEVSETKLHRERLITKMGTTEYKEIASKRAGVEGIPSVLRRKYGVDHLPVRGKVRSKVWLGFKISAINCKRLIKSLVNKDKDSLFKVVHNHLLEVFCFQSAFAAKSAA
jgi:hypothetical protein